MNNFNSNVHQSQQYVHQYEMPNFGNDGQQLSLPSSSSVTSKPMSNMVNPQQMGLSQPSSTMPPLPMNHQNTAVMSPIPLPTSISLYPQSAGQYTNVPMGVYTNSILNNENLGKGIPMNGKRSNIHIKKIVPQQCAEDKVAIAVLREDFDAITKMNLIDDEDTLYTLFMKSPSFIDIEFMINFLINMYRVKYEDLYNRYPSLSIFTTFCLSVVLARSENNLKSICNAASGNIPQGCTKSIFGMMSRKREAIYINTDNTRMRFEVKKRKAQIVHPLLSHSFYLEHKSVFNLGTLTRYCVPTEFSILFTTAKPGAVLKILSRDNKVMYDGIRGTFSRSVVIALQSKAVSTYVFTHAPFMNNIGELITDMTGLSTENDIFNVGIKRKAIFDNITTKTVTGAEKVNYTDGFYMGVLSTFMCVATDSKTVDIRSYVERGYKLDDSVLDMDDKHIAHLEAINASKESELLKIIVEYEKAALETANKFNHSHDKSIDEDEEKYVTVVAAQKITEHNENVDGGDDTNYNNEKNTTDELKN